MKELSAIVLSLMLLALAMAASAVPDAVLIARAAQPGSNAVRATAWWARQKLLHLGLQSCAVEDNGARQPVMGVLAAAYDKPGADRAAVFELMMAFANDGCSVNAVDARSGFSPLHEAISMAQPDLVRFLVGLGADRSLKVHRPGRPFDGMTSPELAMALAQRKSTEERRQVLSVLGSTAAPSHAPMAEAQAPLASTLSPARGLPLQAQVPAAALVAP